MGYTVSCLCLWGPLGPFRIIVLDIDASVGFAVPCQCYRVVLIP